MNTNPNSTARKGALFSYIHLIFSVVSMFVLTPVLLNHLGKAVYGFWAVLNSFLEYFRVFDFGLNTAVSKYTSEYRALNKSEKLTPLVSTAMAAMLVLGAILVLGCVVASPAVPGWFDIPDELITEGRIGFVIVGFNVALMLVSGVLVNTVFGFERVDIWKLFGLIQVATYTLLAIVCVTMGLGLIGVLSASVVSTLLLIVMYVFFLKRNNYPLSFDPRQANLETLKEVTPYSLRSFSLVICSRIQYSTDNIVIGLFMGVAMVGPYEIAYKLCFLTTYIFSVLSSLAFPRFSKLYATQDLVELKQLYLKISKLCVAIMSCLALILIFQGKTFIDLWVGPGNFVGYETFLILIAIDMMHSYASPAGTLLQGIGQNRGLTYSEALNAGLNLIFSLILVNFYGWLGVAMGTLLAQLSTSGWFAPLQVCKYLKFPFSEFIKSSILPPILSGLGTLAFLLIFRSLWEPVNSLFQMVTGAIMTTVIYGSFYYFTGLDPSERQEYRDWLSPSKNKS